MQTWLLILLLHISYVGSGFWLMPLFTQSLRDASVFVRIPLLYFAGILTQIVALHVPLVFGGNAIATAKFGFYFGCAGLVALFVLHRKAGGQRAPSNRGTLAFLLLVPAVAFLAARLLTLPDVEYDSTAFWFLKTRLFLAGDNFWSESFQDPLRVHSHQNYPVYFPLFALQHICFTGIADDWVYKAGIAIYYSIGIALLFGVMKERLNAGWAGCGAGILLYSPVFCYRSIQGSAYSAYADFPLALMIAGAIGTASLAMEKPCVRSFIPAAILVASTFLIKTEGLLFTACFLPATAVILFLRPHGAPGWITRFRPLLAFVPTLLLLAGWLIIRSHLPDDSGLKIGSRGMLHSALQNVPFLLRSAFDHLITFKLWGVLPILLPILFLAAALYRPCPIIELTYATALVAYLFFVVTLFLFMEIDPSSNTVVGLMDATFDRIVIQVTPAMVAVALMALPALKTFRWRSAPPS